MFTWICPECGREVPPSYSECPECAARARAAASGQAATAEAGPAEAPPAPRPAPRRPKPLKFPVWRWWIVLTIAAVVAAGGVFLTYRHGRRAAAKSSPAIVMETPGEAQPAPARTSRLTKHIEIAAIRITEDSQRNLLVRFVVVNHSAADILNLAGSAVLRASTAAPDQEPLLKVPFKIPSLGPYASKELEVTAQGKLRAYELPDWQFLKAEAEITSP